MSLSVLFGIYVITQFIIIPALAIIFFIIWVIKEISKWM